MSNRGRGISVFTTLLLIAPCLYATEPWQGTYSYDGAGNIKAIGNNHYYYDGAGRLVEATAVTSAQSSVRRYSYDAFGNLNKVVTDGDAAHATIISVDSSTNRLTNGTGCPQGTTCIIGQYDAVGHQTGGGDNAIYDFDSVDMLSTLTGGGRDEAYIYDSNDQRIAIVLNASTAPAWRYTLRDAEAKVVREFSAPALDAGTAMTWTKDYIYRDSTLLASVGNTGNGTTQRIHFHVDHLFTPRLLTDDEGRRVSEHTYWAYGLEAAGSDTDSETMKFTGHERDFAGTGSTSDLDYMHARYYSPNEGRFLSLDPKQGQPEKPNSWNRYWYADDSPVNAIDPNGRDTLFFKPVAASAALGVGGSAGYFEAVSSNGDLSKGVMVKGQAGIAGEYGIGVGWARADSAAELEGTTLAAERSFEIGPVGIGIGANINQEGKLDSVSVSLSGGLHIPKSLGGGKLPASATAGGEHVIVLQSHNPKKEAQQLIQQTANKVVKSFNDFVNAVATATRPGLLDSFNVVKLFTKAQ